MKPGDFYVGIISFFAILVPGAVGAAVLEPLIGERIFGPLITAPVEPSAKWVAFLIAAYFIGHLIFLVGSYVDTFYNFVRERLNPYTNESAYRCAVRIRDAMTEEHERKALNAFQWSRAILTALFPAAAGDVHGLEADSKFFRSLMVVFALSGIVFVSQGKWLEGLLALVLVVPCFMRYYERRLKSTTQAYVYVVALHRLGKLSGAGDKTTSIEA